MLKKYHSCKKLILGLGLFSSYFAAAEIELMTYGVNEKGANRYTKISKQALDATPYGDKVAFTSFATNLTPDHTGSRDYPGLFLLDGNNGNIEMISQDVTGDVDMSFRGDIVSYMQFGKVKQYHTYTKEKITIPNGSDARTLNFAVSEDVDKMVFVTEHPSLEGYGNKVILRQSLSNRTTEHPFHNRGVASYIELDLQDYIQIYEGGPSLFFRPVDVVISGAGNKIAVFMQTYRSLIDEYQAIQVYDIKSGETEIIGRDINGNLQLGNATDVKRITKTMNFDLAGKNFIFTSKNNRMTEEQGYPHHLYLYNFSQQSIIRVSEDEDGVPLYMGCVNINYCNYRIYFPSIDYGNDTIVFTRLGGGSAIGGEVFAKNLNTGELRYVSRTSAGEPVSGDRAYINILSEQIYFYSTDFELKDEFSIPRTYGTNLYRLSPN